MKAIVVGVISDTHGMVRPEAIDALRVCDLPIHAGDIGDPEVVERLRALAPVSAVRGNIDTGTWATGIPVTEVVVSGHSHRPSAHSRDGVLYVNPGSAGPRRFKLPITVALLRVTRDEIQSETVELHE